MLRTSMTRKIALLMTLLLAAAFSACSSIPLKPSESESAEAKTKSETPAETKAPEVKKTPRLRYILNSNSVEELVYDEAGHVQQRIRKGISSSAEQSYIITETISFDPDGNIVDYREEQGPDMAQNGEVSLRLEGRSVIITTGSTSVTREYQNGQLVQQTNILSTGEIVINRYDRDEQGLPLRWTQQVFTKDPSDPAGQRQTVETKTYNCVYFRDDNGMPVCSWYKAERETSPLNQSMSYYFYDDHPSWQTRGGRLAAVLNGTSVLYLEYDADGTVRHRESINPRIQGAGTFFTDFDENGNVISYRNESGEVDAQLNGNQMILSGGSSIVTLRQGRTLELETAAGEYIDGTYWQHTVYTMNALGLYESKEVSYYLIPADGGERQSVWDDQCVIERYVYVYGDYENPVWSYRIDEKGQPVRGSIEMYRFK